MVIFKDKYSHFSRHMHYNITAINLDTTFPFIYLAASALEEVRFSFDGWRFGRDMAPDLGFDRLNGKEITSEDV